MNFGILISPFPGDLHLIFCPLIYKIFFFDAPVALQHGLAGGGGVGGYGTIIFLLLRDFVSGQVSGFFIFDIVDDDCTFRLTNVNCFACSVMD